MKKNVIIALAIIPLLASCNKNTATVLGLAPCNEQIAVATADSIYALQYANQDTKLYEDYEQFYNYIPTSVSKFNMVIDLVRHQKTITPSHQYEDNISINKECNLDLDKMCYTCDFSFDEIDDGEIQRAKAKYITFFVLNEEQKEDVKDPDREGTVYCLYESDGLKRRIIPDDFKEPVPYRDFISYLIGVIVDDEDYGWDDDYQTDFDMINADYYSYEAIFHKHLLESFESTVSGWESSHAQTLLEGDENNYLNYYLGSNDPTSLAYQVKAKTTNLEITPEDGIKFTVNSTTNDSLKFTDLYVTDVDFATDFDVKTEFSTTPELTFAIENIGSQSLKRTHKYGTANCTIPTNIDEYVVIEDY